MRRYRYLPEEERLNARAFMNRAHAALATRAPAHLLEAHARLLGWHQQFHSPNRPPYLDCTGCQVWPVILQLRVALTIGPDVKSQKAREEGREIRT